MSSPDQSRQFVVGITMAGAVSAGAYTAGVLDLLLRAFDEHNERARKKLAGSGEKDDPTHRIVLRVLSGASAGGICSGLSLASLVEAREERDGRARLRKPEKRPIPEADQGTQDGAPVDYDVAITTLHDAWVDKIDLWRADGANQQGLLATDDINATHADWAGPIRSVLNSKHLDDAATSALSSITWGGDAGRAKFSFLAKELDLFITTTNLMGVPYLVNFGKTAGEDAHRMAQHSTVRHFRIDWLGAGETMPSPWLDAWRDKGIELVEPEIDAKLFDHESWKKLRNGAIASGAFPIGLASRVIAAEAQDFKPFDDETSARGGALPIDLNPKLSDTEPRLRFAGPDFGRDAKPETSVGYVAVDGGVANNEPFEYARFTLRLNKEQRQQIDERCNLASPTPPDCDFLLPNPRDASLSDRAVIMIDPFPEGPEYKPLRADEIKQKRTLIPSVLDLLPTLIDQARFKPAELVNAADPDVHSRFLIQPRRSAYFPGSTESDVARGADAIASGALGGFAGFMDKRLRVHDFILGQRNAQQFLRERFTLNANNKRVFGGCGSTSGTRCIVHAPDVLGTPIREPLWPKLDDKRLGLLLKRSGIRLAAVGAKLIEELPSGVLRWLARRAWSTKHLFTGGEVRVRQILISTVMSDLIHRNQHVTYAHFSKLQRSIVVELLASADTPATAAELRARLQKKFDKEDRDKPDRDKRVVSTEEVAETLVLLHERETAWRSWKLWGDPKYTHAYFRPGAKTRWLTLPSNLIPKSSTNP